VTGLMQQSMDAPVCAPPGPFEMCAPLGPFEMCAPLGPFEMCAPPGPLGKSSLISLNLAKSNFAALVLLPLPFYHLPPQPPPTIRELYRVRRTQSAARAGRDSVSIFLGRQSPQEMHF
jgi:hypothetical protein